MKGVKNMKKQYVKPELYFENFELSTSIAACDDTTTIKGPISFAGKMIFAPSVQCDEEISADDEETSGYCYHLPEPGHKLFTS